MDDNETMKTLLQKAYGVLRATRLGLHWVQDGEEAMDYLLHRGRYEGAGVAARPDLIILDLNMPRKDGREVLTEIKSHSALSPIPVVVLSHSDMENDRKVVLRLGAACYFKKPASFNELVEVASRILEVHKTGPSESGG